MIRLRITYLKVPKNSMPVHFMFTGVRKLIDILNEHKKILCCNVNKT